MVVLTAFENSSLSKIWGLIEFIMGYSKKRIGTRI